MWLINTETLVLEEFVEGRVPEYAILSHRWGDDEISFHQFPNEKRDSQREGYTKIRDFCAQVAPSNLSGFQNPQLKYYKYAWVDTCCIDKRSSAELSESINSMFKWYRNAGICYAYLSDVDDEHDTRYSQFQSSKWFARGWTLQELLAPREIQFFSKAWRPLGSKTQLVNTLSGITKIPHKYLLGGNLSEASVAQRMSWASSRVTTREEDVAYSLLGIFDVNMPLLYGEGKKAFIRLQEEIIKQTKDHSILAWGCDFRKAPKTPIHDIVPVNGRLNIQPDSALRSNACRRSPFSYSEGRASQSPVHTTAF
ncbi:heterokaryon incompatibility protein-domain-containing protein [Hypoxylon sp. FL1857]|nr:heterokaryon incompatibility protein-domain-containing protein [Hypoxylon sp. FL1857]